MKTLPADCRTDGCGKGASCSPPTDGAVGYVCQCPPGTTGSPQKECAPGKRLFFYVECAFFFFSFSFTRDPLGSRRVSPRASDANRPISRLLFSFRRVYRTCAYITICTYFILYWRRIVKISDSMYRPRKRL